jgi:hypothetical protein
VSSSNEKKKTSDVFFRPETGKRRPTSFFSLAAGAALFIVLATANSGGYRYGASDQAFYVPAVAMSADPTLFPRDRWLFEPQMRLWHGDSVFGWLTSGTDQLPVVFGAIYLTTLAVLLSAAVALGRGLGANWPTVATFLGLLTLKHQITHTGANSLEGYGHPRMLAFALGIAAFACLVNRRRAATAIIVIAAAVVHITTALWFGVAIVVAILWDAPRRSAALVTMAAITAVVITLAFTSLGARLVTMDATWIQAIGDRDYLFSARWPVSTWIVNLGYAVALGAIYRRRRAEGVAVEGEAGFVAGLIALVAVFLVSVPLTELRLALAVQLQVNRVFWLLDAAAAFYIAWWLVSDLARTRGARRQWAVVAAVVAASAARGFYVLGVAPARPAMELDLPRSQWTDAMRWISRQPEKWHVLADPQHVARFGSSVRVASLRDTVLEVGKDPAMAIYDREAARRVLERAHALAGFDAFTATDVRNLAARYDLDVFVDRADRQFDFPILYRNDGFITYDLR